MDYRIKLLRAFWLAVGQAGVTEDDARAFAQGVYPEKRLSTMTTDELEFVCRQFIKVHRINISMPVKKVKPKKVFYRDHRLELATPSQLDLIDNYADELSLQSFHLEALMRRAGAKFGEPLTLKVAQNMIEGMKKMLQRGWKPRQTENTSIEQVEHVTWH
jgi:hypothetical protein